MCSSVDTPPPNNPISVPNTSFVFMYFPALQPVQPLPSVAMGFEVQESLVVLFHCSGLAWNIPRPVQKIAGLHWNEARIFSVCLAT